MSHLLPAVILDRSHGCELRWDTASCNGFARYAVGIGPFPTGVDFGNQTLHFASKISQNGFYIKPSNKHLESPRTLQLTEGQTFLLSAPTDGRCYVRLAFHHGVARLSGCFGDHLSDVTLAFCGDAEAGWLRLPYDNTFLLEALTNSSLELQYSDRLPIEQDLLWKWLFDLHLVRHPVGAEARLITLFQLLVNRFGIRRGDGYLLPIPLGHARIAELIGATRSTVTRQISQLRKLNHLQLIEPDGIFLLSAPLVESTTSLNT
ncbi:MAG: helix-turn-helix domain-containing protein [Prochlorococcus sp.]